MAEDTSQTPTQKEYDQDQAAPPQATQQAQPESLDGWAPVEGSQKPVATAIAPPAQTLEGWAPVEGTQKPVGQPTLTDERPGTIHKLWDWVNKGLISKDTILDVLQRASATGPYQDVTTRRFHPTAHIPGFGDIDLDTLQKGVSDSSSGVTSTFTSPLSIALFGTGAVVNSAGKAAQAARAAASARAAETAVTAADAAHAVRTTEVARAAQQANDARLAAEAAEAAEKAGTGTKAATIAAQDNASAAAANALKAQEALKAAEATKAANAVESAKAAREASRAAAAAKKAGTLGKLPELAKPVATAGKVIQKAAGVGFTALGAKEALTPQQEGESVADAIERRLMGAGFAVLGASGELRGSQAAEGPLSELPGAIADSAGKVAGEFADWHERRQQIKDASKLSDDAIAVKKDWVTAIPPSKAAPYDDNDYEIGRNYTEHHHVNVQAVDGVEGQRDAFEYERQGIENVVRGLVTKYAKEPILTNVKMDVINALKDSDKIKAGFSDEGLKALEDYNLTDPTMEEADAIRAQLNAENRATLKKNSWDVATARATDPAFAAREAAAESLRNGIYDQLEAKKIKGAREMRQDESALIRLRNAADRQLYNGSKTARGTSEAGPVRKLAAKGATLAGAGVGAAVGAATGLPGGPEAGAIVGGYAGKKVGDVIAPPDLTRDQLIQRSMEKKVATGAPTHIEGTGVPSNPPVEGIPTGPSAESQIASELQKLRGEFTALHGDLATHYGENLGDTPYTDLEERFLDDVRIKKEHKVPLDPAEKKLLAGINQAKVDEALQQRGLADEQKKAAQKAQADAEKVRKEKEEAGLKTNLAPPFETEPHIHPEDEKALHHELGHHFQIAKAGHPTHDIIGRLHDQLDPGAEAEARWHPDAFFDDKGNIDLNYLRDNIGSLLDIFHGGAVADEVMSGTPVHKNAGAKTDLFRARTKLIEAGFTPSEAGQLMSASEARVRKDFTTPGVRDIFHRYSQAREAGLDDGLLMSPETSGRAIQEFKDALEGTNETNNEQTPAGKAGAGNREGKPGGASRVPSSRESVGGAAAAARESAGGAGRELRANKLEVAEKPAEESGKELRVPFKEGRTVPPERTAGEHDAAIKEGGAIPGGIQKGDEEIGLKDLALFHDPTTGSTLALPTDKTTAKNVKQQLQKSREEYLKARPEESRIPTKGQPGYDESVHGGLKTEKAVEKPLKDRTVAEQADALNKFEGRPPVKAEPIAHNPEVANRIAQAYEAMSHNPNDPAVKKSYEAAKNDIDTQWHFAQDNMGIKFEPWTKEGQPYANSKEMTADVKDNKHLYFFRGGEMPVDHPLAAVDPKTGLTWNDKLRAIHDLFGHAAHDFQFGPKGEENAWNVHRQMFSPEAIPAITTETRGQNSWVNFGEHLKNAEGKIPAKGEQGYVPPPERPFAQQKSGILPEEFHQPNQTAAEGLKTNKTASPEWKQRVADTKWETDDKPWNSFATGYRELHVKDANGKEVGVLKYAGDEGDLYSRIRTSQLDPTHQNQGIAKEMYKSGIEDARNRGIQEFRSDTSVSDAARHVWEALAREGYPVYREYTKNFNANGSGGVEYTIPLQGQKITDADFEPIFQQHWSDKVAANFEKQPAGGINPENPDAPSKRYGLEILPEARKPLETNPTAEDLQAYAKEHGDKLGLHPDIKLGWDTTGEKPELNIGASTDSLDTATKMAKKLDQRSIYDTQNNKVIDTGGTGKKTSFPEYPLEQRLDDLGLKTNKNLPEDFEFGKNAEGTEDQQKGLISTRVPSGPKSSENPLTQDLTIGRDAIKSNQPMADKMADLVREYPGVRIPDNIKDSGKVLDRFVDHVKENLTRLYNSVSPERRAANMQWYDSANKLASRLAEKYGRSTKQMAGVIAAMSPQKDWDQNVSLANRVNDIYHTKQDIVATPEMMSKAAEIGNRPTGKAFAELGPKVEGKKLSDLTDPTEKAVWIRLYDEAHNPRTFQSIDPATGEGRGEVKTAAGQPQRVAWGGLNEIGKAVSILEDGSRENISNNLGDAHKVRNFYNNILDPNNPAGHVTIDTHAVAAGLARILSGKSPEVLHNFGAAGGPSSTINGVNGTYALYADAYRAAAKELGVQPRQLQSVVWEEIRSMFPAEMKRIQKYPAQVDAIWQQYADRKISLDKAHEMVRQSALDAAREMELNQKQKGPGKVSAQDFLEAMGQGGLFALGGGK